MLAAIVVGTALAVAPSAIASTQDPPPVAAEKHPDTAKIRHATRGVVKSIDEKTLVITRTKNRGDMTFALSPSIQEHGTIAVGTTVSVRYQEEGPKHIATAISARTSKEAAAPASSATP
jgi:hypothetical protein